MAASPTAALAASLACPLALLLLGRYSLPRSEAVLLRGAPTSPSSTHARIHIYYPRPRCVVSARNLVIRVMGVDTRPRTPAYAAIGFALTAFFPAFTLLAVADAFADALPLYASVPARRGPLSAAPAGAAAGAPQRLSALPVSCALGAAAPSVGAGCHARVTAHPRPFRRFYPDPTAWSLRGGRARLRSSRRALHPRLCGPPPPRRPPRAVGRGAAVIRSRHHGVRSSAALRESGTAARAAAAPAARPTPPRGPRRHRGGH